MHISQHSSLTRAHRINNKLENRFSDETVLKLPVFYNSVLASAQQRRATGPTVWDKTIWLVKNMIKFEKSLYRLIASLIRIVIVLW